MQPDEEAEGCRITKKLRAAYLSVFAEVLAGCNCLDHVGCLTVDERLSALDQNLRSEEFVQQRKGSVVLAGGTVYKAKQTACAIRPQTEIQWRLQRGRPLTRTPKFTLAELHALEWPV